MEVKQHLELMENEKGDWRGDNSQWYDGMLGHDVGWMASRKPTLVALPGDL